MKTNTLEPTMEHRLLSTMYTEYKKTGLFPDELDNIYINQFDEFYNQEYSGTLNPDFDKVFTEQYELDWVSGFEDSYGKNNPKRKSTKYLEKNYRKCHNPDATEEQLDFYFKVYEDSFQTGLEYNRLKLVHIGELQGLYMEIKDSLATTERYYIVQGIKDGTLRLVDINNNEIKLKYLELL